MGYVAAPESIKHKNILTRNFGLNW